jgi:excinuclease UvrABC nuclease subunit
MCYAWRRGTQYLYVGKTRQGIDRIRTHNIINVIETRRDDDVIEFWICSDSLELDALEKNLIFLHCPKYNTRMNPYPEIQGSELLNNHELMGCKNPTELRELIRKAQEREDEG